MVDANIDLVIDCHDLETLYEFWADALRYRKIGIEGDHGLLMPDEAAFPPLILQRVPESKTVKNRMHLDIRVPDNDGTQIALGGKGPHPSVEAEAQRLEALGARRIDVGQPKDTYFIPMADPEGNEFCVCPGVPLALGRQSG